MNEALQQAASLDEISMSQDMFVVFLIRHYFTMLRQEKGHKPDASPLDLELLLIVKFITASDGNVIDILRKVGIILIEEKIAINGGILKDTLISSRSRINNTLNKLNWTVVKINNNEKATLFSPILDRSDVRNWTLHEIPPETSLYRYIRENPEVQFRHTPNIVNGSSISLDIIDNIPHETQQQPDMQNPMEIKPPPNENISDSSLMLPL